MDVCTLIRWWWFVPCIKSVIYSFANLHCSGIIRPVVELQHHQYMVPAFCSSSLVWWQIALALAMQKTVDLGWKCHRIMSVQYQQINKISYLWFKLRLILTSDGICWEEEELVSAHSASATSCLLYLALLVVIPEIVGLQSYILSLERVWSYFLAEMWIILGAGTWPNASMS